MVSTRRAIAACIACLCAANPALAWEAPGGTGSTSTDIIDRYQSEWSYRVRPWKRQRVVQVTIEAAGLGDDQRNELHYPNKCTGFRPSERHVKEFVARAKRISWSASGHADWSPCHASGRLRLHDGTEAQWRINSFGVGFLVINGAWHPLQCTACALFDLDVSGRR